MALKLLTRLHISVQCLLLPVLEEEIGPLEDKAKGFVEVCEMLDLPQLLTTCVWQGNGRPPASRLKLAHAFVAKAFYNIPTTKDLIRQLRENTTLRRLCGWDNGPNEVPNESTFSRATFATFASMDLGGRAHKTLIEKHLGDQIIWHSSTDATAIEGRERAVKKPEKDTPAPLQPENPVQAAAAATPAAKRKRGRPRKSHEPSVPPDLTRLQRHLNGTLEDNLIDMPPVQCDHGCKKNAKGHTSYWRGYKLHLATGDGDIPLFAYLSCASMHESQAAIIVEQQVALRTGSVLYQLKDSAYDAAAIRAHSEKMGSVPIIEKRDYRHPDTIPMEPDRRLHYHARSGKERNNSDLKDNHGGRTVRVRGPEKVGLHLMIGILVMTCEALMRHIT